MSAPLKPLQLTQLKNCSPSNKKCAECSSPSPDWASVTYGILICLDCAGIHRGFGVQISFVRSLTMDDWTSDQFDRMMRGGNDKWSDYWLKNASVKEAASCTSLQPRTKRHVADVDRKEIAERLKAKYETDIARSYRELLSLLADADSGPAATNMSPKSASLQPTSQPAKVVLPEEPLPTMNEIKKQTLPFALSLMMQSKKSKFAIFACGLFGVGIIFSVQQRFGCHKYISAAVLAMTVGIPYYIHNTVKMIATGILQNRQDAYKSAKNLLVERISMGRAKRLENCDVYYPPLPKSGERIANVGLVFYPGALVDRTAYSPFATMLSDRGIVVVVANLEPCRILLNAYNYNLKEKLMRMISDSVFLGGDGIWEVNEWTIGGHSAGAFAAITVVAQEMSSTIKKIVLFGTGSYPDKSFADCRPLRETTGVNALVINGSNDAIVKSTVFTGPDKEKVFREKMPPVPPESSAGVATSGRGYTYFETIDGGNHSGFASYGPQTFPIPDGIRTITLEEQQKRAAELTADFLLG